jgi:hypothetical protein
MQKCISDSQIIHYLRNELDELENQHVKDHLNHCAICQKRTEAYSEVACSPFSDPFVMRVNRPMMVAGDSDDESTKT